ncbi:MAG: neisseria PilC beta-propeller domain protein [Betaproteobacteria bacterium]|nr:neisseria PilC beta-propeller domain protein [Betaproteobacteria bacterium]
MKRLAKYLPVLALSLFSWSSANAQLSQVPLLTGTALASNVVFAISVEFPTAITPAYTGSYVPATTYLGYFDPAKCYDYNASYNNPIGTYSTATAITRYFVPAAVAGSGHTCSSKWSGNFMNWVSMAGLDEFRYAMTGGNRIVDTNTITVLQRTFQTSQGGNFGEKSVSGTTLDQATPLGSGTYYFNSSGLNAQMKFGMTSGANTNSVYVQVQVCTIISASSINVESNCNRYGTSIYKPEGTIQKNADGMRFSVLSYFNGNSIDNAVLRAKMKFTGQYTYNLSGAATANTAKEWDPTTGIFVPNPDTADASGSYGGAVTNSGVVNYINKFGSSGQNYKTYDNVGKLYYQALAYLRNLGLSSQFYGGATSANNDGFPVITTAADPIQAYCQKNFIFVMGDTHTWCDKRLPGGTFSSTNNGQCDAIAGVQAADLGGAGYTDTAVNVTTWTNNISSGLATSGTGAGGASFYMAGLAYWAHINDIRPDLNNNSSSVNITGSYSTVSTYIVDVQESNDIGVNSQYWYAAKYGGFDTGNFSSTTGFSITTPAANGTTTNSNWASYDTLYNNGNRNSSNTDGTNTSNNGIRPKNYLPAGNPNAMINAVNSAFSAIADEAGKASATSQSGQSLPSTGGLYIYQSLYTSGTWTGDVIAALVSDAQFSSSGVTISNPVPPNGWSAAQYLTNAAITPPSGRIILTYNDGIANYTGATADNNSLYHRGVAFNSINDLSVAQRAALNADSAGNADGLGASRISYLRGVRTSEKSYAGGVFRNRTSLLGDIVNSAPSYVGAPSSISFETGYNAFAAANISRKPMIYVGANDGMLHAFPADDTDTSTTGREWLAYIPSPAVRKLSQLTDPNYVHTFYADGTPVVQDACLTTCDGTASPTGKWRTVLVAGMNAGGQGIYALDVSSPGTKGNSTNGFASGLPAAGSATPPNGTVLWEFTDSNGDADLGYTFGRPVITKLQNGRWAAIFGNGYYNNASDGTQSSSGKAALYIVYMSGPSGISGVGKNWILGTDYFKITFPSDPGTTSAPNGLGGPAIIDSNFDGATDIVYAADLYGNLWKIDLSASTSATPVLLFAAKDSANNPQPITGGVSAAPSINGGYMVYFGTGAFIRTADSTDTSGQTVYGINDRNDGTVVAANFRSKGTLNSLQQQVFLAGLTDQTVGTRSASALSNCKVNYPGQGLTSTANPWPPTNFTCPSAQAIGDNVNVQPQQLGYYLDLPATGERFTADSVIVDGGISSYITLQPTNVACKGGADVRKYDLDENTGGRTDFNVFDLTGTGLFNQTQQIVAPSAPGGSVIANVVKLPTGSTVNTGSTYGHQSSGQGLTAGSSAGSTATGGCVAPNVFVTGWGCVGSVNTNKVVDTYCGGTTSDLCIREQKSKASGRLYWRQLFTQ